MLFSAGASRLRRPHNTVYHAGTSDIVQSLTPHSRTCANQTFVVCGVGAGAKVMEFVSIPYPVVDEIHANWKSTRGYDPWTHMVVGASVCAKAAGSCTRPASRTRRTCSPPMTPAAMTDGVAPGQAPRRRSAGLPVSTKREGDWYDWYVVRVEQHCRAHPTHAYQIPQWAPR